MASVIRSNMRTILPEIRSRLLSWPTTALHFGEYRAFLVAQSKTVPIQADKVLLIRPLDFTVQRGWADGAGRMATRIDRRISLTVRTRLNIDMDGGADVEWLTNLDYGHLALEEAIPDALEEYFPRNASGDHLTLEPIRMLSGSVPTVGHEVQRGQETQDYGESTLIYTAAYLLDVNQYTNPNQ